MLAESVPYLSIIVPLLNEAQQLPALFDSLQAQLSSSFELILCDGGSEDNTHACVETLAQQTLFPVQIIASSRGRGKQMNAGAAAARGQLLLFLHADSHLEQPQTLSDAVQAFLQHPHVSSPYVAGHFALHFRRHTTHRSLAYYFYEAKTALNRSDCIRGDQGFLMRRSCFTALGGFDESLPFLEDVRFATRLASCGDWIQLPGTLSSSARRFEQEGLCQRQTVNAIIINALVVGWDELLTVLPMLYRSHTCTQQELLSIVLNSIRSLLKHHSMAWQLRFWLATGRHVASNIWQLFFWLDVRRAFRRNMAPEMVIPRWLPICTRYFTGILACTPLAMVVAIAVWCWYRSMLLYGMLNRFDSSCGATETSSPD